MLAIQLTGMIIGLILIQINHLSQEMSPKPAESSLIVYKDSTWKGQTPTKSSSRSHIMDFNANGNITDSTIDKLRLLV